MAILLAAFLTNAFPAEYQPVAVNSVALHWLSEKEAVLIHPEMSLRQPTYLHKRHDRHFASAAA